MEEKMTLYYRKKTGDIMSYCTGVQDMSFFGQTQEDYELIWGYVVVDRDDYVLSNTSQFKINLETKQLEIKQEAISQYPIAAQ